MRWLVISGLVVVVLVLFVFITQLVLPGAAANRISGQFRQGNNSVYVKVSAFPALKLLVHQADNVTLRMNSYHTSSDNLTSGLNELNDTHKLNASVSILKYGLITLHKVTVAKIGSKLTGYAQVYDSDINKAASGLIGDVRPVNAGNGQIMLQGTIGGFTRVNLSIEARGGSILLVPDLPFGSLATITLFANPNISIKTLSLQRLSNGFALNLTAQLV